MKWRTRIGTSGCPTFVHAKKMKRERERERDETRRAATGDSRESLRAFSAAGGAKRRDASQDSPYCSRGGVGGGGGLSRAGQGAFQLLYMREINTGVWQR